MLELGARPDDLHPPAAAAWIPQRALDQPVERVYQQLPLADGRKERERGDDRLRRHPPHHPLGNPPRREEPQPPAGAAELRYHRFFGQRGECAQRPDAELTQATMRVGIERQRGERLGGEKFPLLPGANDDGFPRPRARGRDPGDELSDAPPHTKCGMRNAECGMYV